MGGADEDREFRERMGRMEGLLQGVAEYTDPQARAHTQDIVQAILDLHGAGLERMLRHIAAAREAGPALVEALGRDELVGSLFTLYGLHPLDVETRVRQALDEVRPALHGGDVELLGVSEGTVHLRLRGGCDSCASAAHRKSIEEAVCRRAPDVTGVRIEEATGGQDGPARFALPLLRG